MRTLEGLSAKLRDETDLDAPNDELVLVDHSKSCVSYSKYSVATRSLVAKQARPAEAKGKRRMSRGLGILQRRICDTLNAVEGAALPLRELRRRLGEPDRSNLRRGIRGLLERGLVEETRAGEERRVRLTLRGVLQVHPLPKIPRRVSVHSKLREEMRALEEAREEERRRLEAEAAEGSRWIGYEHRFVRRRFPGPMQTRILSVLWEYADPLEEGLLVTTVKAIVGGDRSNTRRAIRSLLLRGQLDESEDGGRVRLSYSTALWHSWFPPIPPGPVDEERAKEILRTHQVVDLDRQS